ncbi:lipoprotein [Clostridium botulinum C str. Stockholm]|nr:lipoprotein [Clostridium botulinum C str. Stockholm]
MRKKVYLLFAMLMTTIVLSACNSKENQKNKDFDNVTKKIENNKSSSSTYNSTKESSSITKNNWVNPEKIKELIDFEKKVKEDNDTLKKAYKEKIDMKKNSTDIILQEKFKIAMSKITKGEKKLNKKVIMVQKPKKRRFYKGRI